MGSYPIVGRNIRASAARIYLDVRPEISETSPLSIRCSFPGEIGRRSARERRQPKLRLVQFNLPETIGKFW